MRYLLLAAALTCSQADCNGNPTQHVYSLRMIDGTTIQMCASTAEWDAKSTTAPNCLILMDEHLRPLTMICGVESYEFGLPSPFPPAEATPTKEATK